MHEMGLKFRMFQSTRKKGIWNLRRIGKVKANWLIIAMNLKTHAQEGESAKRR